MAHISDYFIVTYERKPGHWRAAVSPKIIDRRGAPGRTVHSTVTPDDSASESEAKLAAAKRVIGRCLAPRPALEWPHARYRN